MKPSKLMIFLSMISVSLVACKIVAPSGLQPKNVDKNVNTIVLPTTTTAPTLTIPTATTVPTAIPTASPQPPTPTPLVIGPEPENIPAGYNPLTGLPVLDPKTLDLPAVLISITNFPPSARPQSGLSFSPWVYEIYIAEGMTRFLATFYGDFPQIPKNANLVIPTQQSSGKQTIKQPPVMDAQIGPVRSGRLAYVYIRDFFQSSCLVYASATVEIRARLRGCAMVFGSDANNINSAMLDVSRLQKIAEKNQRDNLQFNYSGSLFTEKPQSQGLPAKQIDVYYSLLNQSQWKYNASTEKFQKFEDFADDSGRFTPTRDRINSKQLAFSNVVVLYAEHTVINPYIIDVKMGMGERGKAVIFRDGQRFDAFWSTIGGEYEKTTGKRRPLRFVDANGNPFALKPGQTWVHIVTPFSQVLDQGDGLWRLRFYAPAGSK